MIDSVTDLNKVETCIAIYFHQELAHSNNKQHSFLNFRAVLIKDSL